MCKRTHSVKHTYTQTHTHTLTHRHTPTHAQFLDSCCIVGAAVLPGNFLWMLELSGGWSRPLMSPVIWFPLNNTRYLSLYFTISSYSSIGCSFFNACFWTYLLLYCPFKTCLFDFLPFCPPFYNYFSPLLPSLSSCTISLFSHSLLPILNGGR